MPDRTHHATRAPVLSEPGFRALTEHSWDAIVLLDPAGVIQFASPALGRILGLQSADLVEQRFTDLLHPDDRPRFTQAWSALLGSPGGNSILELLAGESADNWRLLEIVATNLLDEPSIQAIVLNIRDITDRRNAENARVESERRFQRLIDANIIGVTFWDRAGGVFGANDALLQTIGYSREELEAGAIRWPEITPAEYRAIDAAKVRDVETTGVATVYEKELIRKDGTRVPVLVGAASLEDSSHYGIAYFLDLTELKQTQAELNESRRRLCLLVDAIRDYAFFSLDPHGVITTWGRGAEQLLGYPAAEIIGRDYAVLFTPEERQAGAPQRLLHLAAEHGNCDCDGWGVTKDGRRIFFTGSIAALHGNGLEGFGKVMRDATEQKRAEELKSAILASVSHDLLTPLAGMLAATQNLRYQKDPEWWLAEGDETLAGLESDVRHLTALVRNLLDLSRLERGAWHPAREWHDLLDITGAVLRRLGDGRGGRVEVRIPEDLPMICVDGVQFAQVLWNLLDNALKYSPPSAPVLLRAWVAGSELCLAVDDQGSGVPAGDQTRIFDRLYRAARTDERSGSRTGGTGLGLAISRAIVEAHSGKLWVERNAAGGATFHVTLPDALP